MEKRITQDLLNEANIKRGFACNASYLGFILRYHFKCKRLTMRQVRKMGARRVRYDKNGCAVGIISRLGVLYDGGGAVYNDW